MAVTPDEIRADYEALTKIAGELGVKASTLAQYVDCAGSYSALTSRDTGVPRVLPPRTSMDGIMVASRVTEAIGTSNARTILIRWTRLLRETASGEDDDTRNPVGGSLDRIAG